MPRSFAIIPAAGLSTRMGQPKLLLPLGERTVVEHVLAAWTASRVTNVLIVVRADDGSLLEQCGRFDVEIVIARTETRDMRASVELAIKHLEHHHYPDPAEPCLIAPADSPQLTPHVIDTVLDEHNPDRPAAVVPAYGGRRGHPLLLPWLLASSISQLPIGAGVNQLLNHVPVRELVWHDSQILEDLDNQRQYAQLRATARV
jgi:molybdenum cofactor cytidylyltransferase